MKVIIACLIVPSLMLLFGIDVDPAAAPTILGLLVAIAGAIFTIMSIWIAFLYPNVLKSLKGENLVNVDFSGSCEDTTSLKEIVSVIVQSATTMIASILLLTTISTLNSADFSTKNWVLGACHFGLVFFCGLQISALLSTIRINLSFMDAIEKQRSKRAKDWDT